MAGAAARAFSDVGERKVQREAGTGAIGPNARRIAPFISWGPADRLPVQRFGTHAPGRGERLLRRRRVSPERVGRRGPSQTNTRRPGAARRSSWSERRLLATEVTPPASRPLSGKLRTRAVDSFRRKELCGSHIAPMDACSTRWPAWVPVFIRCPALVVGLPLLTSYRTRRPSPIARSSLSNPFGEFAPLAAVLDAWSRLAITCPPWDRTSELARAAASRGHHRTRRLPRPLRPPASRLPDGLLTSSAPRAPRPLSNARRPAAARS